MSTASRAPGTRFSRAGRLRLRRGRRYEVARARQALQRGQRLHIAERALLVVPDRGSAVEFGTHCYRASRYYFDTTLVDR